MAVSFHNVALASVGVFLLLLPMASPSIAVDHRGPTQIAIDQASRFAAQTLEAIKLLRDQPGSPPGASLSYAKCTMSYRTAIHKDLASAIEALKRGDFKGVRKQAMLMKVEAFLCEDAFSSKPSPMFEYNNKLSRYCGIIIASVHGL